MGLYDSRRNFGFGKNLGFAGKNALRERYGHGHFATVAAHEKRFARFADHLKIQGIQDARQITTRHVEDYARHLRDEHQAIATIQNAVSSINTTLAALRGDATLWVSPRKAAGASRVTTRHTIPTGLDLQKVQACQQAMIHAKMPRAAAVIGLARTLGLRQREAALANLARLKREMEQTGRINVQDGAKGGRSAKRLVPITPEGRQAILQAMAMAPQGSKNLLDADETWHAFQNGELKQARTTMKAHQIHSYHDLRAAYACERYQSITGHLAPVMAQAPSEDPASIPRAGQSSDEQARHLIALELGHNRPEITSAYIGGKR